MLALFHLLPSNSFSWKEWKNVERLLTNFTYFIDLIWHQFKVSLYSDSLNIYWCQHKGDNDDDGDGDDGNDDDDDDDADDGSGECVMAACVWPAL